MSSLIPVSVFRKKKKKKDGGILRYFQIVAISTVFITQKAVKAWIIANEIHSSFLILKK
jgi:hypothetical protein